MKTIEQLTIQRANELAVESGTTRELSVECGTTRGRGVTVSPLACSFALMAIDLSLLGILAITYFGDTGLTTASGIWSSSKGLTFVFAPFIVALSLWQQGAYTVNQMPPPVFHAVIGCLNGCGLLALSVFFIAVLSPPASAAVNQ